MLLVLDGARLDVNLCFDLYQDLAQLADRLLKLLELAALLQLLVALLLHLRDFGLVRADLLLQLAILHTLWLVSLLGVSGPLA